MRIGVKNTLIFIIFCLGMTNLGHAFDLDETVDDEIRKNYNDTKLIDDVTAKDGALQKSLKNEPEESLPALPSIVNQQNKPVKADVKASTSAPKYIPYTGGSHKVRSGTSFDVVNNTTISDSLQKGTRIKFTSKAAVNGKGYTIPSGTVFYGEVLESHSPQITCNGGLVVIRVNSMIYKEQTVPVKGYITKANGKKIFLNNIKGQRTYLKTMWKKGNWGRALFGRMLNLTVNLGGDGATLVLSPFPFAYGTICLGLNTLTSPICAFFSKGGHLSIPSGNRFRIKLLENTMIN